MMETNSKLPKAIMYTIYVIFGIATVVGVFNSILNSQKISMLPADFSMEEKVKMIEKYDDNIRRAKSDSIRIDTLELTIDSLKNKLRVNEIMDHYRANLPKEIIINDTLKIE